MATIQASEDTYALSDDDTVHGNLNVIATIQTATQTGYTYLKFDLSGWVGKTLSEGLLKLHVNSNELTSDTYITFKRITSTWAESTLKWSNKPTTTDVDKVYTSIFTSTSGWKTWNITDLLQAIIDDGNHYGVFAMLKVVDEAGRVWFDSSEGSYCPKIELTELIVNDYYVKVGGNDALDGKSWTNAWATINKAATTLTDGQTGHIGFGNYVLEPAANKIAPQNIGTSGIYYKPEQAPGGSAAPTVSIEQNP